MDRLAMALDWNGGATLTLERNGVGNVYLAFASESGARADGWLPPHQQHELAGFLQRAAVLSTPDLPPIGTWGQWGYPTATGQVGAVYPAVVTWHHLAQRQVAVAFYRSFEWIESSGHVAATLTPGCWSPLPAWTP